MAEQTYPACSGNRGTDRVHYEIVTNPDGTTTNEQRNTWEPCSTCSGTVVG